MQKYNLRLSSVRQNTVKIGEASNCTQKIRKKYKQFSSNDHSCVQLPMQTRSVNSSPLFRRLFESPFFPFSCFIELETDSKCFYISITSDSCVPTIALPVLVAFSVIVCFSRRRAQHKKKKKLVYKLVAPTADFYYE